MISRSAIVAAGVVAATLAMSAPAHAFCGFYIDGGGKKMFNDATQVVMMRRGTRTVLSMRNTYRGPVEDFAMVVPVPVVLHEGDVKTLQPDVFDHVDLMGSPRLVEYWEQDPCQQRYYKEEMAYPSKAPMGAAMDDAVDKKDLGVTIEAQFDVGEYNIVILSAKESTGLETWLHESGYNIPGKAESALRPYVEAGSKFFVAKVDPKKVTFDGKTAVLSPLRFHYDTDSFELPIRLGLINSSGKQDLIVNILADDRYQLANYKNATIPTNLAVKDEVRKKFPEFYAALFDRTVEKNPGAVITEYSWSAGSCDPCPGPTLDGNDFMTLGADVIDGANSNPEDYYYGGNFVLTRLHARYGKNDATDDLIFEKATPIVGGRENLQANGKLEEGAVEDSYNNFQGRYIIRHPWTGAIKCKDPQRNIWGGPPGGGDEIAMGAGARDTAFVKRGRMRLNRVLKQSVPEIGIKISKHKKKKKKKVVTPPAVIQPKTGSLPSPGTGLGIGFGLGLAGLVVLGGLVRRRRRS